MSDEQLTTQRKFERRQLITLFSGMKAGDEVSYAEIESLVGLDPKMGGDKNLIYTAREHCREVLGIVIEAKPGLFRRATDDEIAGSLTDRRRQRVYRQAMRGAGEAAAVGDFAGLDASAQHQLLAKQAIFGTVAMMSHRETAERLTNRPEDKALAAPDAEEVIAAARQIRQ